MAELKLSQIRTQLREMSESELHQEIAKQRAALYDLRRRNAMRQLDNTAAIRAARKQIARALTILRERELAAQREAK
ncbi:MAG TPA: 50S ribosomal protein L29 [Chthonomonadaceae bacterium]|jgi:large subunit ribosomal protein L29|nr:50S ribosomal protein L29 [Chthonomonadaceae bacterium]